MIPPLRSPRSTAAGVAAVGRALAVLGAFRFGDTSVPLRVLAARTGLYKSTILRLLASLEKQGAVVREPDGTWAPGPILYHWGMIYARGTGLDTKAPAMLDALAEETGAVAAIWVGLDADRRVCLYRSLPPRSGRVYLAPGEILSMGRFATGRVFEEWGGTPAPRRSDVIVALGQRDGEPTSLSAPLFGQSGTLLGALTLIGIGDRFVAELERWKTLIADVAASLSRGQPDGRG